MDPDVLAFYEQGRLSGTPEFRLELLRAQAILRGVLPPAPARVLDVGGGRARTRAGSSTTATTCC